MTSKLKIWAEIYVYHAVLLGPLFGIMAWYGVTEGLDQPQPLSNLAAIAVWILVMLRVHFVHKGEVRESMRRKRRIKNMKL